MSWFLDTNICIYFLKGSHPGIRERLCSKAPVELKIPSIVRAELLLGAEKSTHPAKVRPKVEAFLSLFETIPFDESAAREYALIRAKLEKADTPIGPNDLQIAATVKAHHSTLVTHNTKEFKRITGLKVEDWR